MSALGASLPSSCRCLLTCRSCVGDRGSWRASHSLRPWCGNAATAQRAGRETSDRYNMHRRQDWSAAAAGRNTRQNTRQNKVLWRNIFFQSTLTATTLPPHAQLVLPAQFVLDHYFKIARMATLKIVENNKMWTVDIEIDFSEDRPENPLLVFLHGHGWGAFTVANDLTIGDRLTFALVAQSQFHVSILRSQKPIPKRRKTNPSTKLPPAPQLGRGIPTNGCEGSAEVTRTGTSLAQETRVEAEAPDYPSPSPSGMNSHGFEPMIPQEVAQQDCLICQLAAMTKLDMMKTFGAGFHTVFNE